MKLPNTLASAGCLEDASGDQLQHTDDKPMSLEKVVHGICMKLQKQDIAAKVEIDLPCECEPTHAEDPEAKACNNGEDDELPHQLLHAMFVKSAKPQNFKSPAKFGSEITHKTKKKSHSRKKKRKPKDDRDCGDGGLEKDMMDNVIA
jgi:hypothetical protein